MTKIYSMKNKHPERQPQKAISSGCSFQRYFSSSLLLVIHKRLVLTPASFHKFIPSFHAISFESRPGPGFRGCDGVQGCLLIYLIGVHRFPPDMDHIYNCGKTPQQLRGNYSIKPVCLQGSAWSKRQFFSRLQQV